MANSARRRAQGAAEHFRIDGLMDCLDCLVPVVVSRAPPRRGRGTSRTPRCARAGHTRPPSSLAGGGRRGGRLPTVASGRSTPVLIRDGSPRHGCPGPPRKGPRVAGKGGPGPGARAAAGAAGGSPKPRRLFPLPPTRWATGRPPPHVNQKGPWMAPFLFNMYWLQPGQDNLPAWGWSRTGHDGDGRVPRSGTLPEPDRP